MNRLWPSLLLFLFAAILFVRGCQQAERGQQFHPAHTDTSLGADVLGRVAANADISTGRLQQICGGIAAAIGVVLLVVGLIPRRAKSPTSLPRLAATYTFVPLASADEMPADASLLTEDQAADWLGTRYPSLAATATEKLRQDFAAQRRLDPTKIWCVKNLQVREISVP